MSLRSGGFSNGGSHIVTAASSIPQHPELIPIHLLGPPDPVRPLTFTLLGLVRKGLAYFQETQTGIGHLYM